MAAAATRRGPRGRTLARLVTALALLGSARPTSAQDANATNATNATASVNVTMAPPPPARPSPPPAEATVAPPPPPARPSMDELKAAAARRVLDIPRFVKTEDECPEALLAPPSVVAAADRRFLLPPGRTWGALSFEPAAVTDEDFTRDDVPEPERYLEELVVDFALVAVPDASNLTSADVSLMVPVGAEEADVEGGEATAETTRAVAAKSYIRVLPARSGAPGVVDETTTPYLAIDRLLAAFEDDAVTTTANAASVAAILTPDAPGTYVVLITAVDACNATSHAFVNVTAICSHVPRPKVADTSVGAAIWNQRDARKHADEAHPLGWWAPRVLDGSGTEAVDATEGDYHAHREWLDTEVWAGDVEPLAVSNATTAWDAATPLRSSPFSSWIWWNAAPRWTAGQNEFDGFLYRWTMTSAPLGSNAYRRVFRESNATTMSMDDVDASVTHAESGAVVVHASAPESGETPFVDDAATATATFAPDVVGSYGFRLDVSNVCHAASVAFEASFECNAEPRWVESEIRAYADEKEKACLARRAVAARVEDDDGDDVFVTWSHVRGREGWGELGTAVSGADETDAAAGGAETIADDEDAAAANGTDAAVAVNGTTTTTNATDESEAPTGDSVDGGSASSRTTTTETVAARTFSDGATFTGARSASGGAVLSSYVGNLTGFQPDVPGTYALIATLTDGCTATSAEVFVEVSWSEECDALAAAAEETSTAVTVFLFLLAVSLLSFASRNVAAHPLDPRATRDVAARLREWEHRKAAVKRARLREKWEAGQDARGDAEALKNGGEETAIMDEDERERAAAARRRRRAARARARVARRFAVAVASCAGAREEGSRLVPATTHLWRVLCFVGVFAEGVSLASLAFAKNTAPWWGNTVASVGRALALQLDAPGLYAAHDTLAACVAVAAVAALFHAAYFSSSLEAAPNGTRTPFARGSAKETKRGTLVSSEEESREQKTSAFAETKSGFVVAALASATPFMTWLVAEPIFVPLVASFAAAVTCTHGDAKAPFPHLTRDDDAPCYGSIESVNRATGAVVVAGIVAPAIGAYFVLKIAPRLDPLAVEQPWHALLRLFFKWFLAAFSVLTGEGDMTRHEPRGTNYGVPSGTHRGYPSDGHARRDEAHLLTLSFFLALLYSVNFYAQPVRGAGTSRRMNAARGACFASAFWIATLAFFVTTRASAPVGAGVVSASRETANAFAALLAVSIFFHAGWRHTAARSILFAYPDMSAREMRRESDPRVRAMGVLAGDATDGMCGAFGNWEGLRAHRLATTARKMARGVDYSAASEALGVDRTPGVGIVGLTDEGRDDAADDALVWQIVMQTYFAAGGSGKYGALKGDSRDSRDARLRDAVRKPRSNALFSRFLRRASLSGPGDVSRETPNAGRARGDERVGSRTSRTSFTIDPSVRAHFCDAVSALASSPRGVAMAQKCGLVPLLRRVLLDDSSSNAPARLKAAEACRALAQSRRGAALLCLADDDSFMTSWYHRQRDWFRVLVHLEARYGRAAADLARVSYLLGFGSTRADSMTKSERPNRFDALIDWNVRRWLDDGECGFLTEQGGGDDDDGRGFGDKERLSVLENAKRFGVFIGEALLKIAAPNLVSRLRVARRKSAAARLAAIRAKRHARGDVSTSECLARTVRDEDAEVAVVIASIRAAGDWLRSLREARGAPDPRCAERRLRDAARKDAGSLFRAGGLFGYRDLFESWTLVDDDDFLAQTVPGARVMVKKSELLASQPGGAADAEAGEKAGFFDVESFAEFKEKLAESFGAFRVGVSRVTRPVLEKVFGIVKRHDPDESDSEGDEDVEDEESDGMVSVSADADSDADRDVSVTDFPVGEFASFANRANRNDGLAAFRAFGGGRFQRTEAGSIIARARRSPMDKALDAGIDEGAPGLLESLVACTAHRNERVRATAHEELRRAAKGDEAATVARRALAYAVTVDADADSTGRVRALEWLNSLVVARFRVLADVAADVADALEQKKRQSRDGWGFGSSISSNHDSKRTNANANASALASTEDYARLHPGLAAARSLSRAVDLSLAVGVAEEATPCVDAVLSRAGVRVIARCLEDRASPAVRVAAIHALRDAWETLAAADISRNNARADDLSSRSASARETTEPSSTLTRSASVGASASASETGVEDDFEDDFGVNRAISAPRSTRVRRFLAADAFAKLRFLAESDPDAVVRRAVDAFLTRVAQTEGAETLELELELEMSDDDERDAWSDAPFVEFPADAADNEDALTVSGTVDATNADDEDDEDDEDEDEDEETDVLSVSGAKSVALTGADASATMTGYETMTGYDPTSNDLETNSRRSLSSRSGARSGSGTESESESSFETSTVRSLATSASSWRFGREGEEDRFSFRRVEKQKEAGQAEHALRDDGSTRDFSSRYRSGGAGAKRWDAYVRKNAPPTVRYARSKPTAEKNARRPPPPADTGGRAAGDLTRWSRFVAREPAPAEVARARRGFVQGDDELLNATKEEDIFRERREKDGENSGIEDEAEAVEEGEAARERRERRARGARQVRARVPLRAAPVAGTVLAPTRAALVLGDLTGPGPAAPVVHDLDRPLAPVDPNRPTWRERAAEYILAGGGARGVGGARRGPHERALFRDGRVGLAGRRRESRGGGGGVGVAPHDMFPNEAESRGWDHSSERIGASVYSFDGAAGTGAARYRARSRYGGSDRVSGSDVVEGPKRRGLRDGNPGALLHRQDSRMYDFDGFDFEALDAARAAAAAEYAETDRGGDFGDDEFFSREDDARGDGDSDRAAPSSRDGGR